MLTVSQLSKSFAGRALFDDISLQVNRDDLIGLVGPGKNLRKLPFWQPHIVNVFVLVHVVTDEK
jgi:ABC-type lipopolysaccharide export system ATPase subunit